jgi:hypothetical protein
MTLALALCGSACTPGDTLHVGAPPRAASTSRDQVIQIAHAAMRLPDGWSYSVARMEPDSWSFAFSARHSFNLGQLCERKTGPLGGLLDHEKAFVTGSVYRAPPPSTDSPYRQVPGELELDPGTIATYESSGCRPTYRIDFHSGGYLFTVHVALSKRAGPRVEDEVLDVLNSIAEV